MRKLLLFALLCFWQLGLGAENDPPSQDTDRQDLNPESLLEGDERIAAEVTEADEDEADPSVRFIPTEQISQDLGVSFPVDI
ncbi:MAG: hypothetical protein P8N94_11365 [Gammaproteobacteria bacterium]|nr:hypothetical protein [Gammaproteobacteria bacterium]MDG2338562.1 hypothetical protein [Gammaproteobacteria bacterium]